MIPETIQSCQKNFEPRQVTIIPAVKTREHRSYRTRRKVPVGSKKTISRMYKDKVSEERLVGVGARLQFGRKEGKTIKIKIKMMKKIMAASPPVPPSPVPASPTPGSSWPQPPPGG